MGSMSGPEAQIGSAPKNVEKTDFVKDTFEKFGLSMNLYSNHQSTEKLEHTIEESPVNKRLRALIDGLPDYGFLLESKLMIPQAFFYE